MCSVDRAASDFERDPFCSYRSLLQTTLRQNRVVFLCRGFCCCWGTTWIKSSILQVCRAIVRNTMGASLNTSQSVANPPVDAGSAAFVRVAVPRHLPTMLDYKWIDAQSPQVGQLIEVPLGKQHVHAVVMELLQTSPYKDLKVATPIHELENTLAIPTVEFYRWMARYTLSAPGDPIRAALPRNQMPEKPVLPVHYAACEQTDARMTPQRQKVFNAAVLAPATSAQLAQKAGVSSAVVRGMVQAGLLVPVAVEHKKEAIQFHGIAPDLSNEQQVAADVVHAAVEAKKFKPLLLDGVTGSGKTEVYFDVMAKLLQEDEQAQILVTVPEISLTPQWLQRFEDRFGFKPLVWHTYVTDKQRRETWWDIFSGTGRVVVGARSALFLPFRQLRLVVIDEEHDPSYKQDEQFRYHGRDMGVALASHWKCPVVLASATPSLETWKNALDGKYTHLTLPTRHGNVEMPPVDLIDLKQEKLPRDDFLSPQLLGKIEETVKRGEQALIFLNRRGNAPILVCTDCGEQRGCSSCSATLTVHGDKLVCHHCGYTEPWPDHCPTCEEGRRSAQGKIEGTQGQNAAKSGNEGKEAETDAESEKLSQNWRPYGPGTRRIMTEISTKLPHVRVAIADSDAIDSPAKQKQLVEDIQQQQVDVVIGTQMMAKGHHFPNLTLVGVIDGDMGLSHGDIRAAEKTFQLLTQVAGRAGRGEKKGRVMIQSYQPDQQLFQSLQAYDRDAFYEYELEARKEWGDPPFGRLVALIISGANENMVQQAAQKLAQKAPQEDGVVVLGPAPAPLVKLRDKYRYRLLVKGNKPLQKYVKGWLESVPLPYQIRVVVDVDPLSFM